METQTLKQKSYSKQQFNTLLELLVEKFQPTRIISFGQQRLRNRLKGCFVSKNSEIFHACLLICMETCTRNEHEIQDFVNQRYPCGQITIICHGESTIKEQLENNNRFFITVLSKGNYHYTQSGYLHNQHIPKFKPDMVYDRAHKHVEHRMTLAMGFLECAKDSLSRGNYNITTFSLHQAVEQSCILLIKIYLDYRSDFHNLHRLLGLCRSFSDEPYALLVGESASSKRLFEILCKSYGKTRYAMDFLVSREDAETLFETVKSFLHLVKSMCKTKMQTLSNTESIE